MVGYFRWDLMVYPSGSMEDSAQGDLNCESPAQKKVSEVKRLRDHSCDVLAKNEASFCPCPKNLSEAKLKSFELMALAEETSRQSALLFQDVLCGY